MAKTYRNLQGQVRYQPETGHGMKLWHGREALLDWGYDSLGPPKLYRSEARANRVALRYERRRMRTTWKANE